ncbi:MULTISPECIES: NAD-dependent epimerase/dehydratase family protein [Sphingobacterium]|uniref:L-threonine 3-dehydrogenase n=1 Tax=Sphingobacterium cellulitidis TaxID=1768011 RepID=A0A8H9FW93_9SPHI|nr:MULTISPECIES: NAD-dependent epimerase/dehydratase family protein [Sphingobacterium]MBA8985385.1 nucleoside-diphosphate-sugar epimerase [Sphingobacterium soli]OYD41574.1 NAD-dependent epimerase [Sphingobacterium cellulitidis]OYD45719.1 NAD-dependent epimerase [Sphingobacterium cellulitidis]WFB63807.1 NAD-dependent epimerase/dehydratase family protein [Sphingobacterium sp. WM]GGE10073.1 L-threonine 3-dehydrogenase [Sphingobacterium soli]
MKEVILMIGANGQIGSELAAALRIKFGNENVITSDIRAPKEIAEGEIFETLNVLDKEAIKALIIKYKPTQIYLLAAMLSATGEQYPQKAWDLNMNGLLNVLDLAVELGVKKIFWPSSIAVFGPHSPKVDTPQYCVMDPNSIYGISKLAGERLCEYYHNKYGLDIRSIRYPGIISWRTEPGGGTTDYAVHIFFEAIRQGKYESFLSSTTELPMLYMDDAVRGTIELMDAESEGLSIRSSYNLSGVSFTPTEIAEEIKKILPNFEISYSDNDPRQAIADSWPKSINDDQARADWGWKPTFDLAGMAQDMLENLKTKLK